MRQWALVGARARIHELSAEIEKIRAMFPTEFGPRTGGKKGARSGAKRKKRRLSAAGRKAISEAAKARWAKVKANKEAGTPKRRKTA
jgi:hypothetical protein